MIQVYYDGALYTSWDRIASAVHKRPETVKKLLMENCDKEGVLVHGKLLSRFKSKQAFDAWYAAVSGEKRRAERAMEKKKEKKPMLLRFGYVTHRLGVYRE